MKSKITKKITKKSSLRKNSTYKLINAEKEAKKYPKSFKLPSADIRYSLKPGNYAKVIFNGKPRERMWIKIKKIVGKQYEGFLDNKPLYLKSVKYKNTIKFKPANIIAVMK